MSAFLGPIHFWMYKKIKVQQKIVENILALGEDVIPGLKDKLDSKYGVSETRPLEEAVDEGNIHGWLQANVSREEYKLADSVTLILGENPDKLEKIKSIFWNYGNENSALISKGNASEAYKMISDSLLDGMPCDHANSVLEDSEEKVVWKRNICVHGKYWDDVDGDSNIYYLLRDAFIRGCINETSLVYEKNDNDTNIIKRSIEDE